MIVSVLFVIIDSTNVDHNITLSQLDRITSTNYFGILEGGNFLMANTFYCLYN